MEKEKEMVITTNKKAYHDYYVEDTFEAGVVLVGCEVKSIRLGNINLKDSFVMIKNGEAFMYNVHISPYKMGSYNNVDPKRPRKLLLNKREINKLQKKVEQKGFTIIPIRVYFKGSLAKVEIAVCKGKELHDKRDAIKNKENERNVQRIIKDYK